MQLSDANFEGRMRSGLILLLWIGLTLPVKAQQVFFSNIPRISSGAAYSKVIGENRGGIYVLRHREADIRNNFTLERYSHQLDFLQEQSYKLGKKEKLIKVFTRDSGLLFIHYQRLKYTSELRVYRMGFSVSGVQSSSRIADMVHPESADAVVAEYSTDRNWCSIWAEEAAPDGRQRIRNILYHVPSGKVYNHVHELQFNARAVRIDEGSVSNQGRTACAVVYDDDSRRAADPASQQYFICANDTTAVAEAVPLNAGRFFVSGLDMVSDEFAGRLVVCGFYDYKTPGAAHGLFRINIGTRDTAMALSPLYFMPFERKFVAGIIGAREEEKGEEAENFYIRKIVPRNDGGLLVIAENFHITQQMETFYLNGIPQTSSKNVYNYDDVMFIAVDSAEHTEWTHTLRKRQSSFAASAYYNSIGIYVCDSSVNMIYNDNAAQSNRVIHVNLDRTGRLEQKVLFSSEDAYTAVIPYEGRQTGYNRYVVPLIREKQTTLLKLKMP